MIESDLKSLNEVLIDSMGGDAAQVTFIQCGVVEWVIPLDTGLDDAL